LVKSKIVLIMKNRIIFFGIFLSISACAEMQSSSSQVLDNAGSVVRSGADKLWVDPKAKKEEPKKEPSQETSANYY